MSLNPRHERFDSTTIAVVMACIVFWTLLNWPYQYVATAHQYSMPSSASREFSFDTFQFPGYEIKRGGLPFAYVSHEYDAIPKSLGDWDWKWLLLNGLIALVLTTFLAYAVFWLRHHVASREFKTRFGIYAGSTLLRAGLVCCIVSSIATFAVVVALNDRTDQRLAQQLSVAGAVHRYSLVPEPLLRFVPSPLLARFARIRGVMLWGRSGQPVSLATQIPTLTSFGTIRLAPAVDDLALIAGKTRFNHLNLRSVKIDAPLQQAILSISKLRKLELLGCRGLSESKLDFSKMDRLRELELTNSDVRLASLLATGWPHSLTLMGLSRPFRGSDSLVLRDLPHLVDLRIQRTDVSLNPDLVSIELANVPSLKYLGIETMQKVSLKITSAPRLESIGIGDQPLDRRSVFGEVVPMTLWLESLQLDGLQSLRDLNCDGSDLTSLSLLNMPSLNRLAIGRYGFNNGMAMQNQTAQFKSRTQSLIEDISKCDGPTNIDLSSLPLDDIALDSLANNTKIRSISFMRCGVTGDQLRAISRLPHLTSLDLRGCPVTDTEAIDLLENGLRLKELLVNSDRFERIEVFDRPMLRGFVVPPSLRAKSVQISGSPQLDVELILGHKVERLDIKDGYSLTGLSVDGPIPPGARLQGLRALKFFAFGGQQVDDEFCRSLWQCTDLDHLTIAYGSLSRKALERIGLFTKLTVISVPGSDIDDDLFLGHWSKLIHLSDVNLSDTKISAGTVRFLLSVKNLQKLSINHCDVSQRDLADLVRVKQLVELEVAGIGLDSITLAGCLRRGMMDRLDLSYSSLSNEHLQVLASRGGNSLRFLGLRNCGLSETQLKQIIDGHPQLSVDIEGNGASADFLAELARDKRLLDRRDRDGFIRHLVTEQYSHQADIPAEFEPTRGRIHHDQFNTKQRDD